MEHGDDGHWSLGFPFDGCQKARAAKQKMPVMIFICARWKEVQHRFEDFFFIRSGHRWACIAPAARCMIGWYPISPCL